MNSGSSGYPISILITTYNSSKTVKDALGSAAHQTWPELELIITDDYSTDNTLEVCR